MALLGFLGLSLLWPGGGSLSPRRSEAAESEDTGQLSHGVYFTLKEDTPAARKKLVDSCKKHLTNHPGAVFFSAGTLVEDLNREVNDLDFDVALHVVFENRAAHDKYQTAPRHLKFIEENRETWKQVRVFDAYVGS
jgi:hypothetical protein